MLTMSNNLKQENACQPFHHNYIDIKDAQPLPVHFENNNFLAYTIHLSQNIHIHIWFLYTSYCKMMSLVLQHVSTKPTSSGKGLICYIIILGSSIGQYTAMGIMHTLLRNEREIRTKLTSGVMFSCPRQVSQYGDNSQKRCNQQIN